MSKVTITVEEDASHGVRVVRTAKPTGQEYDNVEVGAGEDRTFDVGDEEVVTILQGTATPAEETEGDAERKKK